MVLQCQVFQQQHQHVQDIHSKDGMIQVQVVEEHNTIQQPEPVQGRTIKHLIQHYMEDGKLININ